MAVHWLAGTSGYSYKEWRGPFYPKDLPADQWLSFYAQQLPAVEINNTFYRMPRTEVVAGWAAAVPDGFRFSIKASRRITHQLKLANAEEPLRYLAERVAVLEHKLGAVLFQLPPAMRKNTERLKATLQAWPRELPAAFEFRHPSWQDNEVQDLLAEHGAALCFAEDDQTGSAALIRTAPWTYLRLRRSSYSTAELKPQLKAVAQSGVDAALAFFKHEDAGAGPALARRLLMLSARPEPQRAPRRRRARASRA